MSLDIETLKILQQDAAFRAQLEPVQDLQLEHGLDQEEASNIVRIARRLDMLCEEDQELKAPVNWMKEGF